VKNHIQVDAGHLQPPGKGITLVYFDRKGVIQHSPYGRGLHAEKAGYIGHFDAAGAQQAADAVIQSLKFKVQSLKLVLYLTLDFPRRGAYGKTLNLELFIILPVTIFPYPMHPKYPSKYRRGIGPAGWGRFA